MPWVALLCQETVVQFRVVDMKRFVLAICCVLSSQFFTQLAVASYFAQDGVSSMMLRNADLLADGQRMLDLSVFMDSYGATSGAASDEDGYVLPGFAYGYNENLSLAVTAPVVAANNSTIGLREVNAVAKYRLGGSRDDGVGVSLSAFTGLLSSKSSEGLGSGERGYGLVMNVSLYGEATTLNLTLGGEKSDIKAAGLSPGYSSEQQLVLAGGIEFRPREKWQYLLEGVFTRTNDTNDNFLLMPGVRYTPDQRMSFYAGAALGLPSDTSMPDWRVTTGVNVNLGVKDETQARRRSVPQSSLAAYASPVMASPGADTGIAQASGAHAVKVADTMPDVHAAASMSGTVAAADGAALAGASPTDTLMLQQIEALRSEIGKLINTPSNAIARVEIQNASGIRGLGEKVAKLLSNQGYSVESISDIARPVDRPTRVYYKAGTKNAEIVYVDRARLGVRKQTRIYFIEGFQQRATRVSLALPGSQRVMPDTELTNVAEIRVVVGKDMKALLMMRPIKQPAT